MSLLDTKLPQLGEEPRPRYRCAVSYFIIIKRVPAAFSTSVMKGNDRNAICFSGLVRLSSQK